MLINFFKSCLKIENSFRYLFHYFCFTVETSSSERIRSLLCFVKNIYHCDICEVKLNGKMLLVLSVKKNLGINFTNVVLTLFLSQPYKFLRQVSHHLRWLIFLPNQIILMLKSFLLIPPPPRVI